MLPPPTGVTVSPTCTVGHALVGMRVGFWRFKEVLDSLQIVPTLAINARVCLDYERVRGPRWKADGNSWGTA